ncbi:glycosyltransferase [Flammeovirga sp. EKP202]|uniref:glycosyltransferase n=1 Tax=Flammeovirga sp. EKP202 TaxID=2770592 RepID=UPI00165F348D|nr:glycosyltransferase [Flammeovirga sp. EKP202]MBD0404484.1 glycosyltransferase [Flammeovirga sp. EKP202]
MKKNSLIVGSLGFPFGSADTYRILQLSRVFTQNNERCTIVNRFPLHSRAITTEENIKVADEIENNISYIHTSLVSFRHDNFIFRNIFKLIGYVLEIIYLIYKRFFKGTKILIVYSTKLQTLKYYARLAKILNYKIVYDYIEYVDSLKKREERDIDITNGFDHQFYNYIDYCITISPYLNTHINKKAPHIPTLQLPPSVSFNEMDKIKSKETEPYILYCGGIAYIHVIKFILKAYKSSKAKQKDISLKIITHGKKNEILKLKQFINNDYSDYKIEILNNLSYEDLISSYKSAKALLIPLSDNVQDMARFPFKICEYTASKTPIITTNNGIINHYFENNNSAFISETYTELDFSKSINEAINNDNRKVGLKSYEIGFKNFNSDNCNIQITKYLEL